MQRVSQLVSTSAPVAVAASIRPHARSSGCLVMSHRPSRTSHVPVRSQQPQQTQPQPPRQTPPSRIQPPNAPPLPQGPYQQQVYPSPSTSQQQQTQFGYPPPPAPPGGNGNGSGGPVKDFVNNYAKALIAGAFVCGLGVGVYYDSEVVLSPQNLSSTQLIDRGSPNSDVCMAYGYSSSVFDMKLYVTYNPFNVYVTQPVIKSGCVLRRANVGILERENLVEKKDVDSCKNRMNTFAFTGDLKNAPEVSCVYHSEEAENQYLRGWMGKDMGNSGASQSQTPPPADTKSD